MQYRGKNKLMVLICLTILQLVLIGVYILSSSQLNLGILLMFGILFLLALVATLLSYRAIKKTEQRIATIPDTYKKVYININELVGVSAMKADEKSTVMSMVLEIFEEASSEGRTVESVTGGNIEHFMTSFMEETKGALTLPYLLCFSGFLYFLYLLSMKLYMVVRNDGFTMVSLEQNTLNVGIALMYAIIAFVFLPLMMITVQTSATKQWTGIKKIIVALPLLIPVAVVAVFIIVDSPEFITFVDKELPIMNSIPKLLLVIVITGVLFIAKGFVKKENTKS